MEEALEVVREAKFACRVEGGRVASVVQASPEGLPRGRYPVEVEFADMHRSYGIVKGEVDWGRLSLRDAAGLLSRLRDGAYWCVVYVLARDAWAMPP